MKTNKKTVSAQLSEIVCLINEKTYDGAIKTLIKAMELLKKEKKHSLGQKYIEKFNEEIKKTGSSIEQKIKIIINEEKKRLAYSLINLGKYLDALGESKPIKKTTIKKALPKKKTKLKIKK